MMRASIVWIVLTLISASGLYLVKQEVIGLEEQVARLDDKIARDREAIRVLHAEWAYLINPDRLAQLAAKHLGLKPPQAGQIADTLEKLPPPRDAAPQAPDVIVPPAKDSAKPTLATMRSDE
jgi:cell division protein FtsL